MLLSLKYKFLFVHIPKTGGTSIRAALNRLRFRDPWFGLQFICSKISKLSGHRLGCKFPRHAKAIAAKEMLPREFFDSLFKFAFVRNPWDLQVSSYHHVKRHYPHLLKGREDFESFLRWKLDRQRPYIYHLDTPTQSEYIKDIDGSLLVDFVGRYENLQEDFDEVCRRIGVKPIKLPHRRHTKDRKDYRVYYNDSTAELVYNYFREDIERFGYSF